MNTFPLTGAGFSFMEVVPYVAGAVAIIHVLVKWQEKRRKKREARAASGGMPEGAAGGVRTAGPWRGRPGLPREFHDYRGWKCLVTRPGECEWDRKLALRGTRTNRFEAFGLPAVYTPDELAGFLGLAGYAALVHLADRHGENTVHSRMTHYRVREIPKRGGGVRRIYAPKPRLKEVQRRILREMLDKVPIHDAATGFRRGRDVAVNASPHVGKQVVLCYDLRDFFPSIRRRRVAAFFQWLGYPPKVARILSFLCTVNVGGAGFVLPQGAPTSPALANALCYRMDRRLAGLARRFDAAYTRYADDLTFSGDECFKRGMKRFVPLVEKIIQGEGFHLHPRKRRFMRRGDRQRVTGLVVNRKLSVAREDYDRLKAILHNAAKARSLESQNREDVEDFHSHLQGRIAWVGRFHPDRAARLRERLDALARRIHPAHPGLAFLLERSEALFKKSKLEECVKVCERILEKDPDNAVVRERHTKATYKRDAFQTLESALLINSQREEKGSNRKR